MICWGLGGFGVGLTGALKVNTKEDMAENSRMIVLWGANIASQPNTARHIISARRRGAKVITIDVRRTEAAAQSDEVLLIQPGTDAALALAVMHVIISEKLYDAAFISSHTTGFEELSRHVLPFAPAWGAAETGLEANQIISFARAYASTRPAMILLGGSSMHKGANGWNAARAISCLPGLTGDFGLPGGGLGPRHGARRRLWWTGNWCTFTLGVCGNGEGCSSRERGQHPSLYRTDCLDQFAKDLFHLIERVGTKRLRTHVATRADT